MSDIGLEPMTSSLSSWRSNQTELIAQEPAPQNEKRRQDFPNYLAKTLRVKRKEGKFSNFAPRLSARSILNSLRQVSEGQKFRRFPSVRT